MTWSPRDNMWFYGHSYGSPGGRTGQTSSIDAGRSRDAIEYENRMSAKRAIDREMDENRDLRTIVKKAFALLSAEERTKTMEFAQSIGYALQEDGRLIKNKDYKPA